MIRRLVIQDLYNGEGYEDPSVITDNPAGIGSLLGAGEISVSDLRNTGMHYSAASITLSNLFDFGNVSLTLRLPLVVGEEGDELAPQGNQLSVSLETAIGGGSF